MSEKTKETLVTIDDIEYILENMEPEQQAMVNHISDLDRKIGSSQFNLEQLQFGKQAFISSLTNSLVEDKSD
jgi:restriction endonuclease S subunit